ncbi:hypothetical protein [Nibricoccus sp. IMCC34717]|uniref:hypothetical protein n=1 Tax=Nibricoccus sp. IMCC34717 TaxID=3034021 RepID=UPI0038506DBE
MSTPAASSPVQPPRLAGTYFEIDGRRQVVVGAHWVPARDALQWPLVWDVADIRKDFASMRALGYNCVRFDCFWAWFEPLPGAYREEAFQQFDVLLALAEEFGLWLNPTFFVGGEVGEAFWDIPWRHGRHPHADPDLLRWQTDHVAEFGRRYAGHPRILAWDLTDEPPFWVARAETTDAMAVNWTRLLAAALRRRDPQHAIVVGTDRADLSHGPFRPDLLVDEVDFLSVHPYPIYDPRLFPDAMQSVRATYAAAFQTLLSAGAGKPAMVQELGASSAQYNPDRIAACDRVASYSSLAAGTNGLVLWCHCDAAPSTLRRAPYRRSPHESQFGLVTHDRQERPRGRDFRLLNATLARLDLTGVEPASPDAGILVPWEWAKAHGDASHFGLTAYSEIPYSATGDGGQLSGQGPRNVDDAVAVLCGAWLNTFILARSAGLTVSFPREHRDWKNQRLLLLPWPLAGTTTHVQHVQTDFWDEVANWVEKGGTLYTSLSADSAIPEMHRWMGLRLADHAPRGSLRLRLVKPLGSLAAGREFTLSGEVSRFGHWPATVDLCGAEVFAVDEAGAPVLVRSRHGRGTVWTCTFPLEAWLASQPSALEGEALELSQLYAGIAADAALTPQISTDDVRVEAGLLAGETHGYAILANHSGEAKSVRLHSQRAVRSAALVLPDGEKSVSLDAVPVDAWHGAIVALRWA